MSLLLDGVNPTLAMKINKGKVITSGAPEEVQSNDQVVDAYLGGV